MKTHNSPRTLTLPKNARSRRSSAIRFGSVAILVLLLASISYFRSSASPAKEGPEKREAVVTTREIASLIGRRSWMPAPPDPEALATYAQDCTTPQTTFHVGDTVCVKATDVPVDFLARRLDWGTTDDTIVHSTNQGNGGSITDSFVVSATTTVAGRAIDSRGVWQIGIINPFFRFPELTTKFTVIDQTNPVADLGIETTLVPPAVQAGAQAVFQLQVTNYGPDASANVNLTDTVPTGTTLVSFGQLSGPTFSCDNGLNSTTCTIASLESNNPAVFVATYQVDQNATVGTEVSNTASIASLSGSGGPTADGNSNNDSTTESTIVAAAPCVLTCPSNVTQNADPGQAGAVVTFSSSTGSSQSACGPDTDIVTTPASGSFFPTGTTVVTSTSGTGGGVCTFLVIVNNPGALSISLNGANPMSVECGDDFSDPGATAVDGQGQSVAVNVTLPQGFDPANPANGSYVLTYTATEGQNQVSTTRTVNVSDTQPPAITIAGANPYRIIQGSCLPFSDPGASAVDGCAGNETVTSSISGPNGLTHVDNTVPGTYTVTYTSSDGTRQATATRTVLVGQFSQDESDQPDTGNVPPTVVLNGNDQVTIECGTPFTDPGATATVCGASVQVTVTGSVNIHAPGNYTLTYSATANGFTTTVTRTVTVTPDNTAPVIQVLGANPMTVECHTSFTDPGATAHDACAGDFAATASGTVNANVVGTYVITYNATDPSGFAATPVTRTVNVVDTTAPVVTPPGPVTVFTGSGATSCGVVISDAALGTATASDSCYGSLAVTRTGVPAGNAFPVGQTTITYSATDPSNNTGTATQTVTVIDNTSPIISCPASITLEPTCPSGAIATYTAPVGTDNCAGATTARTAGLASGSVFPIGNTTVTYTVTDASGNTASCSFTVTVKTPQQTVQAMMAAVTALQPPLSGTQVQGLNSKLQAALDAINQGKTNVACNKLADFISQVSAYINNGTLTSAQGTPLITSANHVRNTIGCTNNPCS